MSDDYARKYMGGGRIRFLDKVRLPRWAGLAMAGVAAAATVASVGAGDVVPALIAVPATFLGWTIMSTIRVAVTDEDVHVQYGLWGPKVALDDLIAVDVIPYQPMKYGGWGIRFGLRGERAYSMPGPGRAVQLRYRTARGERVAVISSAEPEALRAAIEDARRARGSSLAQARDALGVADAPRPEEERAAHEQHVTKDA